MQVERFKHFSELAQDNQIVVLPIEPPRGKILDRHGEVLADNSTAYRLEVASDFAANVMGKNGRPNRRHRHPQKSNRPIAQSEEKPRI